MGGPGSGRQRELRAVEECPVMDVWQAARILRGPGSDCCEFTAGGDDRAIWIAVRPMDDNAWQAELEWSGRRRKPHRQQVRIVPAYPKLGGVRWWWECPATWWKKWETEHPWEHCARRVSKLYLRQGRWACRACHELTYLSCRTGKRRRR